MALLIMLIVWGLICALVGKYAGTKGFSAHANFWGAFFFSPLIMALIVALRSPNQKGVETRALESGDMKKCPSCAEAIKREASKCRYCSTELAV